MKSGDLALFVLLAFLILASPALASSEVKTFKDSEHMIQAELFTDGATVHVLASNGVTCCGPISANILINNTNALTLVLHDENNGFYKGSFKIGSSTGSGNYLQLAHGGTAKITVDFSPIYKSSTEISAYYLKPDATILELSGEQTISLSWDKIAPQLGLENYNIYRSNSEITESDKNLADIFTTGLEEYEDSTVRDGKTYCYAVAAVDPVGNTAPLSNVECADIPDVTPPSSVTGLTARPVQGGRVKLSWNPAEDNVGVKEYYIYRLKSAEEEAKGYFPKVSTETSYTDEGLKEWKTYYYKVSAVDAAENIGLPSPAVSAVPDETPPERVEITASTEQGGRILITWSTVADADHYNLYSAPTEELEAEPRVLSKDSTKFTDLPSTTTFYAVAAVDAAGNEAKISNLVSMTPDSTPPSAVSGLSAVANPDRSITLTWKASLSEDFKQYNIYRSITGSFDFMVPYKVTGINSFTDRELEHGQGYQYVVHTEDRVGNEEHNTNTVSATAVDLSLGLEVVNPEDGIKVSQDLIVVAGVTDPDAVLKISGIEADILLDSNGVFVTIILLKTGENEIIVRAIDPVGNERTEIRTVTNKKKQVDVDSEALRTRVLEQVEALSTKTETGELDELNLTGSMEYLEEADPELDSKGISKMTGLATAAKGGTFWTKLFGVVVVGGVIGLLVGLRNNRLNLESIKKFFRNLIVRLKNLIPSKLRSS